MKSGKEERSEDMLKEEILSVLSGHRQGVSIEDVARSVSISRVTASKYLAVLAAAGEVVMRGVGNTKLHYLTRDYVQLSAAGAARKGGR